MPKLNKLNIVFLEAVQNFGGARKSTIELAGRLQNANYNILIIDFWGSCTPFTDEVYRLKIPIRFIDKREEPVILNHPNKLITTLNYILYLNKWLKYRKRLKVILKEFQTDIIIVNNIKTLSLLSRSKDYKIAYFARGWFLPTTISKIHRIVIKKLVNIYIGVSQATRQAIYAGGFADLKDIYVVPNAMEFSTLPIINNKFISWNNEYSDSPFTILHCGGFLESKGQHIVLEVAKKLKDKKINFKILLVGLVYKGQESEKYYQQIKNNITLNNLENDIEIVLNRENVIEYFYEADVLLHPSSTEGLPRVVMESLGAGKPVIGNAVGGMTDFILNGFTGYLVNYNDVNEYAQAILKFIADKKLYKFMSDNGKSLIRQSYRKDIQLQSFINILNRIGTNEI